MDKIERKCISEESAQAQMDLYLDCYDIRPDSIKDADKKENLEGAIDSVVDHIMRGRIEITEGENDIIVTQKLERPSGDCKEFKYDLGRMGTAKTQMKAAKDGDGYGKMYAFMGSLCGNGIAFVQKLKFADQRAMEALSIVFLG